MKIRHDPIRRLALLALAAGFPLVVRAVDHAPGAPPPPTRPVPEFPSTVATLEAGGFRVTLDTLGFKRDLGYKRFHGHYFRIVQFSAADSGVPTLPGAFTFSLLVDDLPKEVTDLKSLFTHCILSNKLVVRLKDGSLQPVRIPRESRGILYRYPERLSTPPGFPKESGGEFTQWQWYFESIQNGKWFEIHFSRGVPLGAPVPAGVEEGIVRVVRSLQFPPPAPK